MDKEKFDYIAARVDILAQSEGSKQATKDAALAWKRDVADASDEAIEAATAKLVDFLDGRPCPIDNVIAFAQGPAVEMFGQEAAEQILKDQMQRKEQGEKYCNCEACSAAVEILATFDRA